MITFSFALVYIAIVRKSKEAELSFLPMLIAGILDVVLVNLIIN